MFENDDDEDDLVYASSWVVGELRVRYTGGKAVRGRKVEGRRIMTSAERPHLRPWNFDPDGPVARD